MKKDFTCNIIPSPGLKMFLLHLVLAILASRSIGKTTYGSMDEYYSSIHDLNSGGTVELLPSKYDDYGGNIYIWPRVNGSDDINRFRLNISQYSNYPLLTFGYIPGKTLLLFTDKPRFRSQIYSVSNKLNIETIISNSFPFTYQTNVLNFYSNLGEFSAYYSSIRQLDKFSMAEKRQEFIGKLASLRDTLTSEYLQLVRLQLEVMPQDSMIELSESNYDFDRFTYRFDPSEELVSFNTGVGGRVRYNNVETYKDLFKNEITDKFSLLSSYRVFF